MMERRKTERSIATFKSAYVIHDGAIHFVTLRNISLSGICFDAFPGVSVGDAIAFCYDCEGPKSGVVRWVANGRFGVSAEIGKLPGTAPGHQRLRSVRLPLSQTASLFCGGRREEVAVHNLSLRGTCIDAVPGLAIGQLVSISIGGQSFEQATVRWHAGGRAGICFAKPVAPQHFRDLVARLQNHSAGAAGAVPLPLPHARPEITLANTAPVSSAA